MGGGSQRLLILNPTTSFVVLLLELWLLLGCDKFNYCIIVLNVVFGHTQKFHKNHFQGAMNPGRCKHSPQGILNSHRK